MRSVNLVPTHCLDADRRRQRARFWFGAAFVVFVAASVGAVRYTVTRAAAAAAQRRLVAVKAEQAEIALQLQEAEAQRDRLIERAAAWATIRKSHPLAEQLLRVASKTPDGVVLTRLDAAPRAARTAREATPPEESSPTEPLPPLIVSGYAASRTDLNELIAVMETIEGWQSVNLVRAVREPFESGAAIAFEMRCGPPEDSP